MALSRSRFALSPLAETVGAIISLRLGQPDPWMNAWYAANQRPFNQRLERDPVLRGLADLLSSTKWFPDVVALPPGGGMDTSLADEIAPILSLSDAEIRAGLEVSVRHSWIEHDIRWLRGRDLGTRLVAVLRSVWADHVAPDWARRRTALEREVMYRAALLANFGWPRALEGMSRRSQWVGVDSIRFSNQSGADLQVGDDGLQFVPVTLRAGSWLCESETGGYALVYPAQRASDIPSADHVPLARLIGRGRTQILASLSRPATVSELARDLNLSLGTVGFPP